MDPNKLKVLQEHDYKIRPCCALCAHGSFVVSTGSSWGSCFKLKYDHQKHTGPSRPLSIHATGSCDQFKKSELVEKRLESYQQFLTEIT